MLSEEKLRQLAKISAAILHQKALRADEADQALQRLQRERDALLGVDCAMVWTVGDAKTPVARFGI